MCGEVIGSRLSFRGSIGLRGVARRAVISTSSVTLILKVAATELHRLMNRDIMRGQKRGGCNLIRYIEQCFGRGSGDTAISFSGRRALLRGTGERATRLRLTGGEKSIRSASSVRVTMNGVLIIFGEAVLSVPRGLTGRLRKGSTTGVSRVLAGRVGSKLLRLDRFSTTGLKSGVDSARGSS